MRILNFAKRNFKEIIRDPLSIVFAIILPLFLLFIFQQFNIPSEVYKLENFAPSIIIFGYSFITLFTANLIAKDRSTSLLSRLYASPLKSYEFILGYTLSILPIALIQSILFFAVALILGLSFTANILITILIMIPTSLLFVALGILIGSISNDKSAPGIGSIIVQLVAFTSGMYFDVNMAGSFITVLSKVLPFSYTVNIARSSLSNNLLNSKIDLLILIIYIIFVFLLSSFIFKKKMISDNK